MHREKFNRWATAIVAVVVCFAACSGSVYSQQANAALPLPSEIRGLAPRQLASPPRTILPFNTAAEDLQGVDTFVVWLKLKIERSGRIKEIGIIYRSHPNVELADQAVSAAWNRTFDPLPDSVRGPWASYYHEVVLVRRQEEPLQQKSEKKLRAPTGESGDTSAYDLVNLRAPVGFPSYDLYPEMVYICPPDYPRNARIAGDSGTVWVRARVGLKGTVLKAEVGKSSGHQELDKSAVQAAYRCRFKPAAQKGQPAECWVTYRMDFTRGGR
jgi:TonB family protein